MAVLVLGLNYKGVPLDVLERFSIAEHDLPKALSHALASVAIEEVVILSTCNRVEIYASTDAPGDALRDIRAFLSSFHGVDPSDLAARAYVFEDAEAITHLFSVASGIDSMVIGEPQILTQVRRAFRVAQEAGAARGLLASNH
jgi:glutamyl-tRNA reductase